MLKPSYYVRARGYSDPVEQLAQVGEIREKIKKQQEERKLYLQEMKETVRPATPNPEDTQP